MQLIPEVQERVNYWATHAAFDAKTREEVQLLLRENKEKEIVDRFYRDLAFGTGGMRGIMGAGTCRMNVYNIRKASTAVALHLKEAFQGQRDKLKVAISYDSRHQSRAFAQCTAEVLAAHGIHSILTKEMRPVPMLSYMVRHFQCNAGICITASHNPPEYNGFKVYWRSGGQLVPPHDEAITRYYRDLHDYHDLKFMPYAKARQSNLIEEVLEELDTTYLQKVQTLSFNHEGRDSFKIVYTPIHGTGIFAVPAALQKFGFKPGNILIPPSQEKPDGDFPTVASPNPEDPKALTQALELAQKEKADLVLGTDPDSDRIGVIVREGEIYTSLNGNQLGCLLTDYVLSSLQKQKKLPSNSLVIKTVVTSDLQREIAEFYGASCEETLTGFKWICHLIDEYEEGLRKPKKQFVCGGEESYGFLAGDFVRDKDAIIACCIAAEMVAFYKSKGLTLSQKLDELFSRHQVYHETLLTLTLPGKEGADKIQALMQNFRKHPPKTLGGLPVTNIYDYEQLVMREIKGEQWIETGALNFPKSDVLQFVLGEYGKVSVRPSGTEPKIKTYISVVKPSLGAKGKKLQEIKEEVYATVKKIEDELTMC